MPRRRFERPPKPGLARAVVELERDGRTLLLWRREQLVRRHFATDEEAQAQLERRLLRLSRGGFREVAAAPSGPSVHLAEALERGDPALLEDVLACSKPKRLGALAEAWRADARPAVRAALLAYVDDGCDRFGHKRLVKRLFKGAEAAGDDELVGAFACAFDRLTRRVLAAPRYGGEPVAAGLPCVPERLVDGDAYDRFTRRTRRYLARRAWRYFRRLGYRDPPRYVAAMAQALLRYRDEDLGTPLALLDGWTLAHALFGRSEVLRRSPWGISVAPGRSLRELAPAPFFPDAWAEAPARLVTLVRSGRARVVRAFARDLLLAAPAAALAGLGADELVALAQARHEEPRAVAARALGLADLARLPVGAWLALLSTDDAELAAVVAAAFDRHVAPERLSLADAVALAAAPTRAAAERGLAELRRRAVPEAELGLVARAASAPVEAVRREACAWLEGVFGAAAEVDPRVVRDLFDARHAEARGLGLRVRKARFPTDLSLLAAASESPAPDVRDALVRAAEDGLLAAAPGTLRHVALSVVADVHRGRRKREALAKVARRAAEQPDELPSLLPVFRVALASARAAERRGALVELARLALHPAVGEAVRRAFPDLAFGAEATS